MKNNIIRFSTILSGCLLSAVLAGCTDAAERDLVRERDDGQYRAAMADYQAGRLDAALKGFLKAAQQAPGNASVRFQLACLLQDYKKDFLGAYCEFREYLQQHPESDKSSIARTRMAACEENLARLLAAKYKLDDASQHLKTIESLRKQLKDDSERLAASDKELQSLRTRFVALSEERDRLVTSLKDVDELDPQEAAKISPTVVKEAKDLLNEDDSDEEIDRTQMSQEIASLKAEEKSENEGASAILPKQGAEDKAKRDQLRADREKAKKEAEERDRNRHPAEYVVQEGDTLYRLAERFYGRISAWKEIRDANKAVISNDGRLKTGTRIKLPYGIK